MSNGFVMPTKVGVGKHARKDYALPAQCRQVRAQRPLSNTCVWRGHPPEYFDRPDPTFLRMLHDRFHEGKFTRRKDVVISAGNWSGYGATIRRLRIGRTGDILALDYQLLHDDTWWPEVKINLTTGLLYSMTSGTFSNIDRAYNSNAKSENLINFLLAVRCVFFGDTTPDGVQVISTNFIDWSQYGASIQPTQDGQTIFVSFPDASGDLWYYTADFRLTAGQVGNLTCEPSLNERFAGYGVIYLPELGVNKRAGRFISKGGSLPAVFRDYLNAVRICLTHGETAAYDRYKRPQGQENFSPDKLEAVERSFAGFPLKRLASPFGIYDLSVSQRKPVVVLKAPKDYALELAQRYIPLIILQAGFTDAAAEGEKQHGSTHYYGGPDKTASRRALEALVMMLEARMHLPPSLWKAPRALDGNAQRIGTIPLNGTLKTQKDNAGNPRRYYKIAQGHEVPRHDLRKRNRWKENIFRKWVKRVSAEMVPIAPLVTPAKGKRRGLTFILEGGEYQLDDLQKPVPNLLDMLGDETKLTGANRRW